MIGLNPSQLVATSQRQKQRHQPKQQQQQQQPADGLKLKSHEQIYRANLVRIPSKAGSPMINLSTARSGNNDISNQKLQQVVLHQHQQQQQQQPKQRHIVYAAEAVGRPSVMIAGPAQRLVGHKSHNLSERQELPPNWQSVIDLDDHVLLLINEDLVNNQQGVSIAPVVGRRLPTGLPTSGQSRALDKSRSHQLELISDYMTEPTVVLAPVVVGRRSNRMSGKTGLHKQEQRSQIDQTKLQSTGSYLFGDFVNRSSQVRSMRTQNANIQLNEIRQHVLRPIGVVEAQLATPSQKIGYINSSDESRRSSSSSSSSNSSIKKRAARYQNISVMNIANARLDNTSLTPSLDGTRYLNLSVSNSNGKSRKQVSKKTASSKQKKSQLQSILNSSSCSSLYTSITLDKYCCSDPNCVQASDNYDKVSQLPDTQASLLRSISCQKIVPSYCDCIYSEQSPISSVDHNFCQANGHDHVHLPPSNAKPYSMGGQTVLLTGRNVLPVQPKPDPRERYAGEKSSNGTVDSSIRTVSSDTESEAVTQMYESLAAELKAKLGNPKVGPILLPPRDYDTLCRKQGKLFGIESRRSTNPQLVGPIVDSSIRPVNNNEKTSSKSVK